MSSLGFAQASAGATALLLGAAVTGIVPVAHLLPAAPAATPPPVYVSPIVAGTPRSAGSATVKGVTLQASLSHSQLVRGSDGQVYLHCSVSVSDAERESGRRQPVDLALVLDTSGSMIGSMDLLKRATLGIAERLREGDRLTLVTYSTGADLVFQGSPVGAEARLDEAVGSLVATGGTNISDGILTAVEALRSASGDSTRAQRILLMTDGLANQGITEPRGLSQMVHGLRARGIAFSSMGLGDSYDEKLLGTLADVGGGDYHYVDRPEGLAQVYAAEVEALRQLAASQARLRIEPADGVVVQEVLSWNNRRDRDGAQLVELGDLSHGRTLKVVARLRVPAGSTGDLLDAAVVGISFNDLASKTELSADVGELSVGLTDDMTLAQRSVNEAVAADLREASVARQLEKARAAALAGHKAEAKRLVLELESTVGESLDYAAPSGETRSLRFAELADDMAAEGSSERARRAFKQSDAAARAAGR